MAHHTTDEGWTITLPVAGGEGVGFLIAEPGTPEGDGVLVRFRCGDMRHRVVVSQAGPLFRRFAEQPGWSVRLDTAGGTLASHAPARGTEIGAPRPGGSRWSRLLERR